VYPLKPKQNKRASKEKALRAIYFSRKKTWDDLRQRILKIMKDNTDI